MNRTDIYTHLTNVFREVFDDDTLIPHDNMTAMDVATWDSLSNIRMIVAVEVELSINFSTAEIADLQNVGELVTVIEKKLG